MSSGHIFQPPDPEGSPFEKLELPQRANSLWKLERKILHSGLDPDVARNIVDAFKEYDNDRYYEELNNFYKLQHWANVHTHPGGIGEDSDWQFPTRETGWFFVIRERSDGNNYIEAWNHFVERNEEIEVNLGDDLPNNTSIRCHPNGTLYMTYGNGGPYGPLGIYAFNWHTLEPLWSTDLSGMVSSNINARYFDINRAGQVFCLESSSTGSARNLIALNSDGSFMWDIAVNTLGTTEGIACSENFVYYFASRTNTNQDPECVVEQYTYTGQKVNEREFRDEEPFGDGSTIAVTPDQNVLIGRRSGIHKISADLDSDIWTYSLRTGGLGRNQVFSVDNNGLLFTPNSHSDDYLLTIISNSGSFVDELNLGSGLTNSTSAPMVTLFENFIIRHSGPTFQTTLRDLNGSVIGSINDIRIQIPVSIPGLAGSFYPEWTP